MIKLVNGNILDSKCQALVCPVNTQGTMGAGLAHQFAERWPQCVEEYRDVAINLSGKIKHGGDVFFDDVSIWNNETNSQYIIYFATKEHYQDPSKLEWIDRGLKNFAQLYPKYEIESVAFPMIGCGLGELSKFPVLELMTKHLEKEKCIAEVYI